MKTSERFPSRFVQASDLPPEGTVVRIDKVRKEKVGQGSDQKEKPVVSFTNASKGLVLNRVNNDAIVDLFGDDDRDWHGQKIELYPTTTTFGSKTVPCVRVRAVDSGAKAKAEPEPESEDPAPKPKKKSKPLPSKDESDLGDDLNDEVPF
jgi:hypothetical protein